MNSRRQWRCIPLLLVMGLAAAGCDPLRGYDLMDVSISPDRLHRIDGLDLERMAEEDKPSAPATQTQPGAPPRKLTLTRQQCRALALAGNLALRVELLSPTIAAQSVTEAEAQFESAFVAEAAYTKSNAPVTDDALETDVKSIEITPGIRIPLRTGGEVTAALPFTRAETTSDSADLTRAYSTDFTVSVSQPLLRGAGLRANTHAIRLARLELLRSEALTKLEVIRVLAAADRVYWRLFAAREELKVRKQEHDLAQTQLARARRQVAAGAKPEVEVMRAELGVAERLEDIIVAENAVRDRQRDLKRILQKPGLGMDTPTRLIPGTAPTVTRYAVSARRLVGLALANRMELLELELQIAEDASTIDFERNRTLPLVTLGYTYNVGALGDNSHDTFDMLFDRRFEDHQFGLQVEIPIGNELARSRLRRAILTRIQRLATRRRREELIRQEVYNTIDQLEANWQRIVASRRRVVHAARVHQAEVRQFNVGLRTSTEVLEAQASLADARSAEIRALTEYQIALVDIAVATGTLEGAARVRWDPVVPEDIAKE